MVLAGVSLWLLRKKDNQSFALARRLTAKTAAAIAVLVGLLTLAEHLFGVDFGIDRLFLVTAPNARAVMSPLAAGGFVLLALALLGPDWRTRRRTGVAQFLCFGAMMGAFLGFLGLGSRSKPTFVTFFAMASGLLCSRPAWAMGGLLTSRSVCAARLRVVCFHPPRKQIKRPTRIPRNPLSPPSSLAWKVWPPRPTNH
jgi:hypothetical protein